MIDPLSDEHFMKKALLEAELALQKGEVPVGVVVVALVRLSLEDTT